MFKSLSFQEVCFCLYKCTAFVCLAACVCTVCCLETVVVVVMADLEEHGGADAVRVAVRCRPLNDKEKKGHLVVRTSS